MNDKITIVTGASSNHFNCLKNLLWSITKFEPSASVVAYDLGLTTEEAKQIPHIHKFDYSKYPDYFNIDKDSGRMGFRPVSVQSAAKEFGGIVIWLDAGCLLTAPITDIIQSTKKNGVYCFRTFGTIGQTLHSNSHQALNVTDDILEKRLRDAGVASFDTTNPKAIELINKWADTAQHRHATAPEGSTRKNHRQDAVFSVLLEHSGLNLQCSRSRVLKTKQDNLSLAEAKRRYEKWRL